MAVAVLNYLGFGGPSEPASQEQEQEKHTMRALPANWYSSQEMYELERRAIFSRKWQFITHKMRLSEPGAYLRYETAGFQFVLCRDRQGQIHGFHNVCRHRAFPVVLEDQGTSKIFSCKYHGWSYGLNGKLAKAPGYQDLDGFDKSKNGLFPIHVHIDCNGFIWVNLDAKEEPEVAWEDDFEGIDCQERYKIYDFDNYVFDHKWEMDGPYNWKILADNYNECYHCATSHPDIATVANIQTYAVNTKAAQIIHNPGTTDEQRDNGFAIASTYYFPNASTSISPNFFMIQRFVIHGPSSSTMQYEVYRNKSASDEEFDVVNQIYKRIMTEDKDLCLRAQQNLNAGVFVNGELHPRMEKGPLYFQKVVRDTILAHHKREQAAKGEIWPARQVLPNVDSASKEDMDFCSGLACQTNQEAISW